MDKLFFTLLSSIIFFLVTSLSASETQLAPSISFGPVLIGENRIPINLQDFEIAVDHSLRNLDIKVRFLKNSLQWVRVQQILLLPRARIRVMSSLQAQEVDIKFEGKSILFQNAPNGGSYSEFFVSLFQLAPIALYIHGKFAGNISLYAKDFPSDNNEERHLIDYSCAPFELNIQGLQGEFYSAGCQLLRDGGFGQERGLLEVYLSTPNFNLLSGGSSPYVVTMVNNDPVKLSLKNQKNVRRQVQINAQVPPRIYRLKTAVGLGPYLFETQSYGKSSGKKLTSPVMLYANLYLTPSTSLRAFEALVYNKSLFNNYGLYFAYDVGSALDERLKLIPLLGFQGVTFHHEHSPSYSKIIFPQGFELVYKHSFGLKNYSFVFGLFFSPKSNENYNNVWIRWGNKIFWEINYLSWREQQFYARTFGLSVGIPFLSLF